MIELDRDEAVHAQTNVAEIAKRFGADHDEIVVENGMATEVTMRYLRPLTAGGAMSRIRTLVDALVLERVATGKFEAVPVEGVAQLAEAAA